MAKTPKHILEAKAEYNRKPDVQAKRVESNAARREAIRDGRAKVGDGKDVAHKVALENGGSNAKENTKMQDKGKNRGWRKGQTGYKVPNDK